MLERDETGGGSSWTWICEHLGPDVLRMGAVGADSPGAWPRTRTATLMLDSSDDEGVAAVGLRTAPEGARIPAPLFGELGPAEDGSLSDERTDEDVEARSDCDEDEGIRRGAI